MRNWRKKVIDRLTQNFTEQARRKNPSTRVYLVPGTGNITVTVKKPVNGDLIYYVGKVNGGSSSGSTVTHDRTTIQVTSAAGSAVTTPEFTATYFDEQKSKDITVSSQNGKVEVFKNVEVTLKFPAMNPSDPNPTEAD